VVISGNDLLEHLSLASGQSQRGPSREWLPSEHRQH